MSKEQPPKAIELLLSNRRALEENFGIENPRYTPPSPDHYPHQWLWDSCFAANTFARYGYCDEAASELESIMEGQQDNGFIPNMRFAPKGRRLDPERYSFMQPLSRSDYTQPPLMASTAREVYGSFSRNDQEHAGRVFLEDLYPSLVRGYEYFGAHRQNSKTDLLIGNIHPHETGRDSDPTFDFMKLRLGRSGPETSKIVNTLNTALDYSSIIALNYFMRLKKWDVEKTREKFWVNDVMFNCIYASNLLEMSEIAATLGKQNDAVAFKQWGRAVEEQIMDKMWRPDARLGSGAFFALKESEPVEEISISNLFPLMLPSLKPAQLESCMKLIDTSFNTKYPLPSVATDSPNYDPNYKEKARLWRGPTWINTNDLIARSLEMQAKRWDVPGNLQALCDQIASRIDTSTAALVSSGYYEFYSPETGEPYRVKNFSWSALSYPEERTS